MEMIASRYSSNFSFRDGLSQEDILCWRLIDDVDEMMKYRDLVATCPEGQYHVLDQNTIQFEFFLSKITQQGT